MSENATNEKNCRHGIDRSIVLCTDCDAAEGRFLERAELTKQINDLPEMLRQYVHDLEADADPAGDKMRIVCLEENMAGLTDEIDRQRAEVERLTRERDHFQACWNAVSDIRADRDRLMKLLEIERGVVLTRGQALTRALRCFDELLDNVWPNGLPSTVDAVVEQMRRALENGKRPPSETAGDWLTNEQCDDVIAFLEDYEWTGLTRENVRTWCTAIAEARSSVNGKGGHE